MLLVVAGQHCRASRCKKVQVKHNFYKFLTKKKIKKIKKNFRRAGQNLPSSKV